MRELERLLGRKTMEVEVLKEAFRRAGKKARLAVAVAASGRFPVKAVSETLGVARSNLVEQLTGCARPRRRYHRQGDGALLAAIRQLTDVRPTYGYRRITALLNRARRAS